MHHIDSHFHHFLYSHLRNKELDELYISVAIRLLARSLINIFVPIYLLTLGFGIRDVAFYYIMYRIFVTTFFPIGTISNSKIGVKKTMAIGTFIMVIAYIIMTYER